jgi:hypothetical protein
MDRKIPETQRSQAFTNDKTGDPAGTARSAFSNCFDQIVGFQADGISR